MKFYLYTFLVFAIVLNGGDSCGITTHIEIGERAAEYLGILSEGIDYHELVRKHPDAFQAGSSYPDAYYSGLCYDGIYHQVSEDTHWTPFINATINYIRKTYPRPWDDATEKLVVFLFSSIQHSVSDASWHSLGLPQGFLDVMGKINYHGSFGDAHSDGDIGGDVVNIYGLDMDYIALIDTWYVPTDDLLNIYTELYGQSGRISGEVIDNCTFLLFMGRLGENLGVIEVIYPYFARNSPFLIDRLHDYPVGGVDDMAVWTHNVWEEAVMMLDHGTEICDLPNNPLYINCNPSAAAGSKGGGQSRPKQPQKQMILPQSKMLSVYEELFENVHVSEENVVARKKGRGMTLSATDEYKERLLNHLAEKHVITVNSRESGWAEKSDDDINSRVGDFNYVTALPYSRLGENLLSCDVNNDGIEDLIITAPVFASPGNYQQGRIYVVYGQEEGLPVTNSTIEEVANFVLTGVEVNGRFGSSVACADLNADGLKDLVVGAPHVGSQTLSYKGEVYIYFGSSQGDPSNEPNVVITCPEQYCNLGWSLTSGDLNNDGFEDLIIGAPIAPAGGEQRGFVAVLYASSQLSGRSNFTVDDLNWRWNGEQNYDWFGLSLTTTKTSTAGEVWLLVGAPYYRICFRADCAYSSLDTQAAGKLYGFRSPLNEPQLEMTGNKEFQQFGFALTSGRFAGKQVVAVTQAVGDNANVTQEGIVSVFDADLLGSGAEVPSFVVGGQNDFARFGFQVQFTDVNNDEIEDLLISEPHWSDSRRVGAESGRLHVYNGDIGNTSDQFMEPAVIVTGDEKTRLGRSFQVLRFPNKVVLAVAAPHSNEGSRLGGKITFIDLSQA